MRFFIGGFNSDFEGDKFGGFDQIENLCCLGGEAGSDWYGGMEIGDYVFPKKDAKIKSLWRLREYGSISLQGKVEPVAKFDEILKFKKDITLDEFTRFKYFDLDVNLLNKTKKFVRGCGFHELKYIGPSDVLNNLEIFNFENNLRNFYITTKINQTKLQEHDINIVIEGEEFKIDGIYELINGNLKENNSLSKLYKEKNKTKYSLKELLKRNAERAKKRNYLSKVIKALNSEGSFCENSPVQLYDNLIVAGVEVIKSKVSNEVNESKSEYGNQKLNNLQIDISKNQILYGPPGTGKTYNSIYKALEIINYNKYLELSLDSNRRKEAINEYKNLVEKGQISFCTFHQSYGYEEFIEGFRSNKNGGFELVDGIFKEICKKASQSKENFVLIIDEINRGNISKIFGELITLIEDDKRLGCKNEIEVKLPYSKELFAVPNNLYIVGTMNTADKSIALMDTALRRRFEFIEYMPNEEELPIDVDGINLRRFLETINLRLEYLLDREHTIGHAFFLKENLSFENLLSILQNKVIPLLKEYFYDDYEKIGLVLGGFAQKDEDGYFVQREKIDTKKLFKGLYLDSYEDEYKYYITDEPTKDAFINVYCEE